MSKVLFLCCLLPWAASLYAQIDIHPVTLGPGKTGIPSKEPNYTSYTARHQAVGPEWLRHNAAFRSHPDAGYIPPERPDSNAVELFAKRTETTRHYVDVRNPARIFSQSAYGALHYRKGREWLLIDPRLFPKGKDTTEASRQKEPVGFDFGKQHAYIKTMNGVVRFNTWKLYGKKEGQKKLLASARWNNATAGDDGVFIKNLFPGVDAEMQVGRGRIKTNLIIRRWDFEAFDTYLVADTYDAGADATLSFTNGSEAGGTLDFKKGPELLARIGKALVYPADDAAAAAYLAYELEGNQGGIVLPHALLTALLRKGPVVLDPLVTGAEATLPQNGPLNSHNNADCKTDFNPGCSYTWPVEIPARITVERVLLNAKITTFAPCTRDKMYFSYGFGDARCGTRYKWFTEGLPKTPGVTAGGKGDTEFYNDCFKPGCEPTSISVHLSILRTCMGPDGCEATCVEGTGPFTVTIVGRTLEMPDLTLSTKGEEVCPGTEVTLKAAPEFGIPGYTYRWTPGGYADGEIKVKPDKTTTYAVTVNDACGSAITRQAEIKVAAPKPPGSVKIEALEGTSVCEGESISFASVLTDMEAAQYRWKVNGTFVNGANDAGLTLNAPRDGDVIELEVDDRHVCAVSEKKLSNKIRVTVRPSVKPAVALSATPGSAAICKGTEIRFKAGPTNGGDKPEYQWYINGVANGLTAQEFGTDKLQDGDKVTVKMKASGECVSEREVGSNEIAVRVHMPKEVHIRKEICAGEAPYKWNGQVLTATGRASFTTPSAETGCDSTTYLELFIAEAPVRLRREVTGCGAVSVDGRTFKDSRVLEDTLRNRFGCDSVYRSTDIRLLYGEPEEVSMAVFECDSADYGGKRYFASTVIEETFRSQSGCDSLKRTVNVSVENFDLEIKSALPQVLYTGEPFRLWVASSVPDYRILAWEPSALFNSLDNEQKLIAQKGETYTVRAETPRGCRASASLRVNVEETPRAPFYPESFTPNADHVNDEWRLLKSVDKLDVRVFNRWGECIYHSTDPSHPWDGRYKGVLVQPGVYVYKVRINDRFDYTGSVTVTY